VLERIKLALHIGKKLRVWKLYDCHMVAEGAMLCKMEASEFDRVNKEEGGVIPEMDGQLYTFMQTPAYPIIIMRDKPLSEKKGYIT